MNRRRADTAAGLLVAAIFLFGGVLSWQAYQRQQAFEQMGSMMGMGSSMGAAHGTSPLWYVFGTLFVSAVVGGGYLLVRDEFTSPDVETRSQAPAANADGPESTASPAEQPAGETTPESQPQARVLDLLPEDERRLLEPVLSSPGLTQIELRDRSDFSKSKVSQTVSALEKRGLLYRERQGRTYRVYPSDDLEQNQTS
ncbi:helix-turn-helix transcriptional regulator [Haloarcula salinisoli]|uniref:MarR family transcriptional regulator n=1 Tax=Haloarcula salinisoli TaxID=2487746 RepID=A0A8J8C9W8_9EURY|nr:MarR family transcriptional regulator [Halomicroarcula salinisoli]MBX0305787.1 MarR family transcriptional regulator [Halomicroarcula salinisoli]